MRKFQAEGDIAHQPILVSKTRVITLPCVNIKISAVCYFVSSQSTRLTDGWTDRVTIPKTALV